MIEVQVNMTDNPFIKLFKSPNAYYVFDVNKDNIIKVSEKTYSYLQALLKDNNTLCVDEGVLSEVNNLKNNGYLSNKRITVIKHPCYDDIETYLERNINMITLQLTQNCNLRCSYCVYSDFYNNQQRSHSAKRMLFETAKRAIDFYANHSIDCNRASIGFYGGEPLLEFDLIKKIVAYAEEIFSQKELLFNITTNGTLLTLENVAFFTEKKITMLLSIDGPKEIHNINRRFAINGKGSFDVIIQNVRMIQKNFPDYLKKVSINMVMDPQNEYDKINTVFENEILKDTLSRASVIDDSYSIEKNIYSEKYIEQKEYNMFLAYLRQLKRIDSDKVSPIAMYELSELNNKISKFGKKISLPIVGSHSGPCIPGQARLFINVEGLMYPCERVSEESSIMQIGNLDTGFDFDKARLLLDVASLTADDCQNCWAINHCTICSKFADDGDNLSADMKISHCNNTRYQTLDTLKSIVLFQEGKTCYGEKHYE